GADLRADRSAWTPKARRRAALVTGAVAVAAFATAGGLAWSAAGLRQDAQSADGARRATLNEELARRNTRAVGALRGRGVLAATAAALLAWERARREGRAGGRSRRWSWRRRRWARASPRCRSKGRRVPVRPPDTCARTASASRAPPGTRPRRWTAPAVTRT